MDDHNHTHSTHSAKCDVADCDYVAETHAHDDETAAVDLSHALAEHNLEVHGTKTDPQDIVEEVSAKTKIIG